ncbi:MAG: ribosomal protein L7/L12 [Ignavibacteria bacterium]|nr:ribosomal protein L7/L12 [Ignavibacteria bacterium]
MNTYIIIGLAVGLVFVLILIRVVYRKEKTPGQRKFQNPGFAINDPVLNSKVKEYLAAEKKIEAIKYLRESTGIGLLEAKNFVENSLRPAGLIIITENHLTPAGTFLQKKIQCLMRSLSL